uniref:EGF-like domain-containing protein n=1 Tax=Trichuris muris TaxID=70415 RepID=A0A5S6QNU3_TRIMR
MALLIGYFILLLRLRLTNSDDDHGLKCPHQVYPKKFTGYVLAGAYKPCVTLLYKQNMTYVNYTDLFNLAIQLCKRELPHGNPIALNYLDLDETRKKYGRFKGASNWVKYIGNKEHSVFLGWKITKFHRGQRMVIEFGDGTRKVYRRTHPEVEDFVKRAEHKDYRRKYQKKHERLPACGVYNMVTSKTKLIKCDNQDDGKFIHSFVCESDGYYSCHREERSKRCVLVSDAKCCSRTEFVVLRNSTIPGEGCPALVDNCKVRCDTMEPSERWKYVDEEFKANPGEVCGNVTTRRFWIPSHYEQRDCLQESCCVEERIEDFGTCPCTPNRCLNGGRCINMNATVFKCICTQNYKGMLCEDERVVDEEDEFKEAETFWSYAWLHLTIAAGASAVTALLCSLLGYYKGKLDILVAEADEDTT